VQIHEIVLIVTLILEIQGGQPIATATGFFYHQDGNTYLVTSRHVVINEKKDHKPEHLVLLHSDNNDLTKSKRFQVDLYRDGKPLWHDHPDYSNFGIDITVVELDQKRLRKGHVFKALSKQSFFPSKFVVMPGEDVFVMGYPHGRFDSVHNLPLMRNAMVSNAHGIPFIGKPCFLIDGNMNPGMSGSPVLNKPKRNFQKKDGDTVTLPDLSIYFLGVFTSTMSIRSPGGDDKAMELGAVWYPELIEEIINSISNSR